LNVARQFLLFGGAENLKNNPGAEQAAQAGEQAAQALMRLSGQKPPADLEAMAEDSRRKVDSIADTAVQADRDQVLKFLGINPNGNSALFVFLSWSMPLPLLRAYAIEAMWSGATLVFRGVPPGKELGTFMLKDLRELVYDKGASANISIDPRLFDEYSVKVVPTIVLTNSRDQVHCAGANKVSFTYNEQNLSYTTCPAAPADQYDAMEGGVTVSYALEEFKKGGNAGAQQYLNAIAKGWFDKKAPGKSQEPFTGKWSDVLSPEQLSAAQSAASSLGVSPLKK
jgi:type-F conjugative transfer system pilin assembly protein TrbC